jgi:hypothetical protein
MSGSSRPRKVLLLEFNEITRTVIDPLVAKGRLPAFARLLDDGAWAAPMSVDLPPHLDPWVTWVTLHTGVDRSVHGATVLEQDASTVRAKRTWDYAIDAGKSVGVFGSISAYPPRPVPGFMIPGPFAPSNATYPSYVEPVQVVNRRYTQAHHKTGDAGGPLEAARLGLELAKLGLKASTVATIVAQLVRERVEPGAHFRRVALQPLLNYDVFEMLYRRYQPAYATWHTNHAAHYMHHYWRAYDDTGFLVPSPAEEKKMYGEAVPFGYEVCDELLARFMRLVDDDTVIVLATSMGQKPYVTELFPEGRVVVRFKDVKRVLDIVGARGVTEIVPVMMPQVNVRIPDATERARVRTLLENAEARGGTRPQAFAVSENGDLLTLTPLGHRKGVGEVRYRFPGAPGDRDPGYALEELFLTDTPTEKQGMHDPRGMLALWGKGIKKGARLDETTNLDVAPTLLSLLGIPVPSVMRGRILGEAWDQKPRSEGAAAALA